MLTLRMQARAIWRLMHTDDDLGSINAEEFSEPWRTIYQIVERCLSQGMEPYAALETAVTRAASGNKGDDYWNHVRQLVATINGAGDAAGYSSYAELASSLPPVEWLWEPWIPRGMLSLLGAWQGTGKSWFALDLARIVTQGQTWPDGAPLSSHGPAIYVEAEAVPRITVDRIRAMNISARSIYPLLPDNYGMLDLTKRAWQDRLTDMVDQLRPQLVIIDSLTNVSDAGQNSVEDVKNLLMYLVRLADFANCGMVVIHHLRKPAGGQLTLPGVNIHDFRGSGHITAMARTILGLSVVQKGKQFSLNGPRRLELAKTNLGPYPAPLGVEITETAGVKQFVYGDAPSGEKNTLDECKAWLLDLISDGPVSSKEALQAGEEAGYNRDTVFDARASLLSENVIVNTKGTHHRGNKWALHDYQEESTESTESETL